MTIIFMKLLGWAWGALPGILSTLTGIGSKVSSDATARYQAGTAASATVAQASLGADVEINKLKQQDADNNRSWWVTAWEKPLLFYLCAMHFGAIMIDTTWHMGWRIPAPPPPYDTWEGIILLADVVALTTQGLTQKIVSAIWK